MDNVLMHMPKHEYYIPSKRTNYITQNVHTYTASCLCRRQILIY